MIIFTMAGAQLDTSFFSGTINTGNINSGDVVTNTLHTLVVDPKNFLTSSTGGYILGGFLLLLYVSILLRVAKDASARYRSIRGPVIWVLFVAVFTPLLGMPLYRALRPSMYKQNRLRRREALDLETVMCFKCHIMNRITSKHCIFCGSKLTHSCHKCGEEYPYDHPHCPHCGVKNKAL